MYVLRRLTTTTPESRSQRTRYLHQSVSRLHPNQIPKRVLHSLSPPSSASPYLARHFTARCRRSSIGSSSSRSRAWSSGWPGRKRLWLLHTTLPKAQRVPSRPCGPKRKKSLFGFPNRGGGVGGAIESELGKDRSPPPFGLYVTYPHLPRRICHPASARGGSAEWDRAGSSAARQSERRCDGTTARRKRFAMAPRQPTATVVCLGGYDDGAIRG
jgi:hypothetical protein